MSEKQFSSGTVAGERVHSDEYVKQLKADHADAIAVLFKKIIKPLRLISTPGYEKDKIESHVKTANDMKEDFDKNIPEHKMLADILETIIYEHGGNKSEWFGPMCQVIKTSFHDDYINGVDLVVTTPVEDQGDARLALGMDASYGSDLHDKFGKILEKIKSGELGYVEYFSYTQPNGQEFAGRLKNIPHVVVGVGIETLNELRALRRKVGGDKNAAEQSRETERREKLLANHPAQLIILKEIELQLNTFARYAKGFPNQQELANTMDAERKRIRAQISKKEAAGIKCRDDDPVLVEIRRNLEFIEEQIGKRQLAA